MSTQSDPDLEEAVNAILGARSLLTEWRGAGVAKSARACGMLAATRMLIEASAAAARAAAAVAEEAQDTAEGLDEHGEALLALAGALEDHCDAAETEAWTFFGAMQDAASEGGAS